MKNENLSASSQERDEITLRVNTHFVDGFVVQTTLTEPEQFLYVVVGAVFFAGQSFFRLDHGQQWGFLQFVLCFCERYNNPKNEKLIANERFG